jgi:magnesium transporter
MSKKQIYRRSRKKGMPPESMVYTGHRQAQPPLIHTAWYNDARLDEHQGWLPEICRTQGGVAWVDIRNLSDTARIEQVGHHFGVHPLALEDVLDTHQRAKLEEYDDMLFFVLPNLRLDTAQMDLVSEQIALALGPHYVISFQEDPDDTLVSLRHRLQEGLGRLRKKKPTTSATPSSIPLWIIIT